MPPALLLLKRAALSGDRFSAHFTSDTGTRHISVSFFFWGGQCEHEGKWYPTLVASAQLGSCKPEKGGTGRLKRQRWCSAPSSGATGPLLARPQASRNKSSADGCVMFPNFKIISVNIIKIPVEADKMCYVSAGQTGPRLEKF